MNKKAQSGKVIVSFPVILVVVLIMAIFVFIASSAALIKKPIAINEESAPFESDSLLETQTLTFENQQKEFALVDILILRLNNKISFDQAQNSFSDFLKEKDQNNYCFIAFLNTDIFYLYYSKANPKDKSTAQIFTQRELNTKVFQDVYEKKKVFRYVSLTNNQQKIQQIKYYYGPCLTKPTST